MQPKPRTTKTPKPLEQENLLVIDTETTGLSPHINKTLTVGLLLIKPQKLRPKILAQDHIFIRHSNYNANPMALKINKINLENHHKIAIPPTKACQKINQFLIKNKAQQTTLLGHNIGFDKKFLSSLFNQGNCDPLFHHASQDTLQIWRELQKKELIPPTLSGRLSCVADYFQVDRTGAHDALADCKITAKVYHEMLKLRN